MSLEAPENEELSIQTQTQSFQFFCHNYQRYVSANIKKVKFDSDLFSNVL